MIEIGKYNELVVLKSTSIISIGDRLKVFVYLDNDNRPVATTLKPFATVGEFVFLMVKELNQHDAFLNSGIDRDIFVPLKWKMAFCH